MDASLYDVYLTGKLAADVTIDTASQRLAALFKSTPAAMAGMLNGKPQLLKRGVDKATALKYREALQKAGVEVAFKSVGGAMPADTPATPVTSTLPATSTTPTTPPRAEAITTTASTGLELAPRGADVLTENERHVFEPTAIDTSHLSVAEPGLLPSLHADIEPVAPLINHLSMAPLGDLLNESERHHLPPVAPDTDGLSLAPAGALIETLTTRTAAVTPDISQLTVAPAGAELLTDEQRRKPAVSAPDTTHLQLVKP
jgi:hypothetical protein